MSSSHPQITVSAVVQCDARQLWQYYTLPEHITRWNFAAESWCCPRAENDLRKGGRLNWRMEARDGSMGFDFSGHYEEVKPYSQISYQIDDGRKVWIELKEGPGPATTIIQRFEADETQPLSLQQEGWQSILHNFKHYAETEGLRTTAG